MLNGKHQRLVAEASLGEVNKPTTRNTRDANDLNVHAKRLLSLLKQSETSASTGGYIVYGTASASVSSLSLLRK